jgi:hypothetical protein
LAIPGSTIVTQLEENEAETEKGFIKIKVGKKLEIDFVPLEKNRKFFYEEIRVEKGSSIREQIKEKLKSIEAKKLSKSPLIKIKIVGKEAEVLDRELRDIEKKYSDKAIINFSKELESPEITQKIEFLRNLREQKLSVEEMGLELLKKNLEELGFESTFDYDNIFKLLGDGKVEKTLNILLGEQLTLDQALKKSLK